MRIQVIYNCLLIFSLACLGALNVKAQQLPLINHYADNLNTINPAFFSTNYSVEGYDMNFSLTHRSQWVNIEGAPTTQLMAAEIIYDKINLITGGYVINDLAGPLGQAGFYGKAGFYFAGRNLEDGAISGALSVGYNQFRLDGEGVRFRDDEPTIVDQSAYYPDIGLGIAFFKKIDFGFLDGDVIYGGISAPQIFNLEYTITNVQEEQYQLARVRHYYANFGYTKYYDNDTYFEAVSWFKYTTGAGTHSDINIKYKMNQAFWIGAGFSTRAAIQLNTGFMFYDVMGKDTAMKVGYTFTEHYNSNSVYFGNSHELTLSFFRTRNRRSYGF